MALLNFKEVSKPSSEGNDISTKIPKVLGLLNLE
jgi:hypothetical protein